MEYFVDIVEIATGRIDKSIPCANERKQMNMYALMSTRVNDRYEVVYRDEQINHPIAGNKQEEYGTEQKAPDI